ncbi:MAG: hypothetical protein A3I15_03250, partial [Chlamydiae bacterium RIFCSPLOWO2_02_FULL_49_12]
EESRGEASLALAEPLLQRDRKEIRQKKWLAEARGSAYRPNDRLFRKIYSDLLAAGGLLLDYTFKRHWSVATEIEFLQKTGHSIGKHDGTRMQLIPISVLLRYHCFIGTVYDLYFGLGPRYFILRTQNDLNAVRRNTTDQALGGVAEAGVLFQIGPSLTFDLFFAYSYGKITGSPKKTNIEGRSLNVGGLQAGAGIGFRF